MKVFLAQTNAAEYVITAKTIEDARQIYNQHFKDQKISIPAAGVISEIPIEAETIFRLRRGLAR